MRPWDVQVIDGFCLTRQTVPAPVGETEVIVPIMVELLEDALCTIVSSPTNSTFTLNKLFTVMLVGTVQLQVIGEAEGVQVQPDPVSLLPAPSTVPIVVE